jgi:hypothetical protein
MAATRVYRGTYREDWQDSDWVDGGTVVQIDTDIPILRDFELDDTDVFIYITDQVGTPAIGPVTKTRVDDKLVVTFENTAASGNQLKYVVKIAMNHSIIK